MPAAKLQTRRDKRLFRDLMRPRVLDRRHCAGARLLPTILFAETGSCARSTRDRLKWPYQTCLAHERPLPPWTRWALWSGQKRRGLLLECHLYTGRTHQIRVHYATLVILSAISSTVKDTSFNLGLTRQVLHSWHVQFEHPYGREYRGSRLHCQKTCKKLILFLRALCLWEELVGNEICPIAVGHD